MEPAVPSGSIAPLTQDVATLAIMEDDEEYENVYDVPFVTVNRIKATGQLEGEVLLSRVPEIDLDRVRTALSVGREHGCTSYSRIFGDYDNVLIEFTDDPDKGLIYALESDLGLPAW